MLKKAFELVGETARTQTMSMGRMPAQRLELQPNSTDEKEQCEELR
uniref:Uncharacterized protein n=1 Tax=Rhizophora mucronata TaxID=61149 RepID=A0A2P2P8A5_RHIMU